MTFPCRTWASAWLAAAAVPLLATEPAAQSGAETRFSTGSRVQAAGGSAASGSFEVEVDLASTPGGPVHASASYSFTGGVAWMSADLGTDAPIVFGFADASGTKDGGDARTLYGANLQASGAGATTVRIGGTPASGVAVQSDSELTLTTPGGVNQHGNPLGRSDVELQNAIGTSRAGEAFRFDPSLTLDGTPQLGAGYEIRLHAQPGALALLSIGFEQPGVTVPFKYIDGALELPLLLFTFPLAFVPSGTKAWPLPVDDDPSLVGFDVPFQAVAVDAIAPLSGSFTNVLHVVVQD